jgi:chemotaxis protein CheC
MGSDDQNLTDYQIDALKEIGNIGAGNAATALSQMVGRQINLSVTKVMALKTDAIAGFVGGIQQDVAAVHMPVYGDVCGQVLIFFPLDRLAELSGMLVGQSEKNVAPLTELGESAVKELGSILAGSYLSALYRFCRIQMLHGVPTLVIDMAQAILDTVIVELEQKDEMAIVIETELIENEKQLTGSFFLVPEAGSLQRLFNAISASMELFGNG